MVRPIKSPLLCRATSCDSRLPKDLTRDLPIRAGSCPDTQPILGRKLAATVCALSVLEPSPVFYRILFDLLPERVVHRRRVSRGRLPETLKVITGSSWNGELLQCRRAALFRPASASESASPVRFRPVSIGRRRRT